jgi:hypothetical protein
MRRTGDIAARFARVNGVNPAYRVSDIIALAPAYGTTTTDDIRIHFICHFTCHGWSMLHSMMELPRLLAKIGRGLIELSELSELEVALGAPGEKEAK